MSVSASWHWKARLLTLGSEHGVSDDHLHLVGSWDKRNLDLDNPSRPLKGNRER